MFITSVSNMFIRRRFDHHFLEICSVEVYGKVLS